MAKIRLVRSVPGNGFDEAIDCFVTSYLEAPFNIFLVLPDAAVRDEVKRSIADRGIPVFGASVCTLNELAEYFFKSLNHSELPIDQNLIELILYKLLEDDQARLTLFNGAWGTVQAMVPEIRAFLETLQDFQVDYPRCLGDLRSERSEQLGWIRDLYLEFLTSNHLVDRGLMLKWITKAIIENDQIRIDRIFFYGLHEPKPIEKDLIQAIISKAGAAEYYLPFIAKSKAFADEGSWLSAIKVEDRCLSEAESALASFYWPSSKKKLDTIAKGVFRDPLDEMRAVAREIRALIRSGAELSSIAVILPLRSKSAPLVREVFNDCGLPFDLHLETPLAESPLVTSIFSILEVVHSDYDRDYVVRMICSPFFSYGFDHGGKSTILSGHEVDEVSLEAAITGGREAWTSALSSLATQTRDEMLEVEENGSSKHLKIKLEKIERVGSGLRQLFGELAMLEGDLTVPQRTAALRKMLLRLELLDNLEKEDALLYEREVRALNSFLAALEAMEVGEALAPSGSMGTAEFLAKLRLLASAEGFHEAPENRNAVQVTGLRASYLLRFDHVFIVGMIDGDIPFLAASNSFVREREAVKMGLLSKEDVLRQERFYFLSSLLASNLRTYISRPESDGSNLLVPSYFFASLDAAFDLRTFGDEGRESSSVCCQRRVGEMISQKRALEEISVDLKVPLGEICQRIAVECDERVGDYHSPYDGVFADEAVIGELQVGLVKRNVYSPSRLEAYAKCPFSYYLRYVLGIEPQPELETELTPVSRGTLFHRIAHRFYSELRDEGNTRFTRSQLDEMTRRIKRIGQEELDRYAFEGPAWQAFQATMLGSDTRKGLLRAFLEKEVTNRSDLSPAFFELSFGLPVKQGEADPSSKPDPVEIDLVGEKLRLRCRIDRVDACPDGRFAAIDYKTGAYAPSVSAIEKGIALQLPLYLQAVESAMAGMKGIGGAYYAVRSESEVDHKGIFGDKDHGEELKLYFGERKKFREEFAEIIQRSNQFIVSYLGSMRAGKFHPNVGPAQCPNGCEYAAICRCDANRSGGEDDAD